MTELAAAGFRQEPDGTWRIPVPSDANIAADTVGRHAHGSRAGHVALVFEDADGALRRWTFEQLDREATAVAVGLRAHGVERGQPVGIHTGQSPETAIAHLALYKLGAVAVTLSQMYGPETLRHIVRDCGVALIVTQSRFVAAFRELTEELSTRITLVTPGPHDGCIDMSRLAASPAGGFTPVTTSANEPALLMYTSGSTGKPKGLLHAHRILHAYMPTVRLFYNLATQEPDAVFWSPADWAWVGGLLDLVLPAWAEGQTVVATQHRFDAPWAMDFMARHRVTHSFMTPTALKRLAEVEQPRARRDLHLRVVCTGGESLPSEIVRWSREELGAVCNEFYGLTEFNHLVGNCERL
ncbi:MAG TPA: AMP-binding protein, partial [Candidatus Binatia bacterium]|nr:AMP-binding protein [Candidatus Binatia bacterium]